MQQARIIATPEYEKRISKLLPLEDRQEAENHIASNPEAHPIIPGTKGVRKARWSRPGMGKRGGIRVIYYYWIKPDAVVFVFAYAKNEMENLSDAQKKQIRRFVEALKESD